jgi:hypothetical protein
VAQSVAIEAGAALPRYGSRGWIQSPAWDLFWMFSAVWGGALLLALTRFGEAAAVAAALFAGNRLLSMFHSWSTTYMVLGSSLLREERRRSPQTYVVAPLLITSLGLAVGVAVGTSVRFPADGRLTLALWPFLLYILLFWVGHFWHFGNQDFGVLTLYRARAGQGSARDRRVDRVFATAMMFVIQPVVYVHAVTKAAFSEIAFTYVPFLRGSIDLLAGAAVAGALLLTLAVCAFELAKPNRSLPKLLYYGVMLLHPVLLHYSAQTRSYELAALYVISYLWSHWFVAIGLVSRVNSGYYEQSGDPPARALLRHAALIGSIGVFFFVFTAKHAHYSIFNLEGFRYKQVLNGIGPEEALVVGLFLGYFLAEQLLHYYCDRRLFRFREAGVRAAVAPLILRPRRAA